MLIQLKLPLVVKNNAQIQLVKQLVLQFLTIVKLLLVFGILPQVNVKNFQVVLHVETDLQILYA